MRRSVLLVSLVGFILMVIHMAAAQDESRRAQFTITHREEAPSILEIRLIPHLGGREIYFDMRTDHARRGEGIWVRRRLQPVEPGLYRLQYRFPEGGTWGLYVHHGSGLAGFDAYVRADIGPEPGGTQSFSAPFRYFPHGAERLPAYVQPAGYAGVALLAALLVFLVARILGQLRRQLEPAGHPT